MLWIVPSVHARIKDKKGKPYKQHYICQEILT